MFGFEVNVEKIKVSGQAAIMGVVMALVAGVIGLVIVLSVINDGAISPNFTGIVATVVDFIPVFFALGLMGLAGAVAVFRG